MSLSAHPTLLFKKGSKIKVPSGMLSTFGLVFMDSTGIPENTQAAPNKILY